ncbi:MAG: methenyltetrahydromethanopterin cyclohydrolase, partial [Candidatus Bathyarchaeia archaeon]
MVDASLSVNKGAYRVAEEAVANAEVLGIEVYTVDCGATVIDFGVGVRGSVRSGILFARACMGDLAQVSMFSIDYDGLVLPAVHVSSDNPTVATIG